MIDISIIVPIYNSEKYVRRCINSILNQSKKNIEIILVDDGSKDNSYDICKEFKEGNDNIILIQKENGGVASARNEGLKVARGKYIAFVDSDDYIEENMFSIMYDAIENDADLVFNSITTISSDNIALSTDIINLNSQYGKEVLLYFFQTGIFVTCVCGLFKFSIINENKLRFSNHIKYGEDQEFLYKYILHCNKVISIPKAIYYYFRHEESAMSQCSYSQFQSVDAMKSFLDYSKSIVSKAYYEKLYLAIYNNRLIHSIYHTVILLLINKEKVSEIKRFLNDNKYSNILDEAIVDKDKNYYRFWRIWNISRNLCLYIYALRIRLGIIGRKLIPKERC